MALVFSVSSDLKGMTSEVPAIFTQYDSQNAACIMGAITGPISADAAGSANFEFLYSADDISYELKHSERLNLKNDRALFGHICSFNGPNTGVIEGTIAGQDLNCGTDSRVGYWKIQISISGKIVDFPMEMWALNGASGASLTNYRLQGNGYADLEFKYAGTANP